jgi:hypothetical protein
MDFFDVSFTSISARTSGQQRLFRCPTSAEKDALEILSWSNSFLENPTQFSARPGSSRPIAKRCVPATVAGTFDEKCGQCIEVAQKERSD